jgi:uncharacterized Zn finger protein (UPF0148 family)
MNQIEHEWAETRPMTIEHCKHCGTPRNRAKPTECPVLLRAALNERTNYAAELEYRVFDVENERDVLRAELERSIDRNDAKLALNRLRRLVGDSIPAPLAIAALERVGRTPCSND